MQEGTVYTLFFQVNTVDSDEWNSGPRVRHFLDDLMEQVPGNFKKMLMVLCTLFTHINIIPTRQKIHLI